MSLTGTKARHTSERSTKRITAAGVLLRFAAAYCMCAVAFFGVLVAVYCLPVEPLYPQVEQSIPVIQQQGTYPQRVSTEDQERIDNYTTAIMLNMAVHNNGGIIERAMNGSRYSFGDGGAIADLADGYQLPANTPYLRYWHGWLLVLKPLLYVFNLVEIERLFMVIMAALGALVSCGLAIKRGARYGVAFAAALMLVNAHVAAISLSCAFVFYIALIASAVILFRRPFEGLPRLKWSLLFFVLGALTVYFDFLTTPVVTLGVPLAVLLVDSPETLKETSWKDLALFVLACCVAWGAGYVLLWATKWMLATVVTGEDVIADAIMNVRFRSGDHHLDHSHVSLIDPVLYGGTILYSGALGLSVAIIATICLAVAIRRGFTISPKLLVSLMVVATLPYLWVMATREHATTHAWFVYRNQFAALVAVFFAFCSLGGVSPARRHEV